MKKYSSITEKIPFPLTIFRVWCNERNIKLFPCQFAYLSALRSPKSKGYVEMYDRATGKTELIRYLIHFNEDEWHKPCLVKVGDAWSEYFDLFRNKQLHFTHIQHEKKHLGLPSVPRNPLLICEDEIIKPGLHLYKIETEKWEYAFIKSVFVFAETQAEAFDLFRESNKDSLQYIKSREWSISLITPEKRIIFEEIID